MFGRQFGIGFHPIGQAATIALPLHPFVQHAAVVVGDVYVLELVPDLIRQSRVEREGGVGRHNVSEEAPRWLVFPTLCLDRSLPYDIPWEREVTL